VSVEQVPDSCADRVQLVVRPGIKVQEHGLTVRKSRMHDPRVPGWNGLFHHVTPCHVASRA
jgi:hypothetical protein